MCGLSQTIMPQFDGWDFVFDESCSFNRDVNRLVMTANGVLSAVHPAAD